MAAHMGLAGVHAFAARASTSCGLGSNCARNLATIEPAISSLNPKSP